MGYLEIALMGAVVGGAGAAIAMLIRPGRPCPKCRAPLPKISFSTPASRKRTGMPLGGFCCKSCGCITDAKGQSV